MADARVVPELGEVEQPAGPSGAQAHEAPERLQVADLGEVPHVPLEVRLEVLGEPFARVEPAVVDAGIETAHGVLRPGAGRRRVAVAGRQQVVDLRRRPPRELGQREREERAQAHAAGKRLRDAFHQQEVAGTGQQEPAGRGVVVHQYLDVREEVGRPLHLVQDDRVLEAAEEPARVVEREGALVRPLERHVPVQGEGVAQQRGLAGLSRAVHRHHGVLCCGPAQPAGQMARDHHVRLKMSSSIYTGNARPVAPGLRLAFLRRSCASVVDTLRWQLLRCGDVEAVRSEDAVKR